MKSQRRNQQSQKKNSQRQNQQNRNSRKNKQNKSRSKNTNNNARQNNLVHLLQNKTQNKSSHRQGHRSQKQKKSLQKKQQRRSPKQQQRAQQQKRAQQQQKRGQQQQKKRNYPKKQRQSKSKKLQKGGYSVLDHSSPLPCTVNAEGISVVDMDSTNDAAFAVGNCDGGLNFFDAEVGADDDVSVISGLSDFVRGGTTQVINERTGRGGDGSTREETQRLLRHVGNENRYQRLGAIDGGEDGTELTRNTLQQREFDDLGRNATPRWNSLVAAGYAGEPDDMFPNPVPTDSS